MQNINPTLREDISGENVKPTHHPGPPVAADILNMVSWVERRLEGDRHARRRVQRIESAIEIHSVETIKPSACSSLSSVSGRMRYKQI
jgi:hypothetical protein